MTKFAHFIAKNLKMQRQIQRCENLNFKWSLLFKLEKAVTLAFTVQTLQYVKLCISGKVTSKLKIQE